MAEHPNVQGLRRGYEAYGTGDLATLRDLLADDEHAVGLLTGMAERAGKRIEQKVVHRLLDVDVGVAGGVEGAEAAVQADVDAGRLDGVVVQRLDDQPAGVDRLPQAPVGEDHLEGSQGEGCCSAAFCHGFVAPAQAGRLESWLLRA